MPLPALSTPQLLAERLGVDEPDPQTQTLVRDRWITALEDASNELRRVIGQPITAMSSTVDVVLDGCGRGVIPFCPVRTVSDLLDVDGAGLVADVDVQVRGQRVAALRHLPRSQAGDVVVTLTVGHGWAEVPGDILKYVYVLAAAQIGATGRGNLGMTGGLQQVSVDDGRAVFTDAPIELPERIQMQLRAAYGGIAA